MDRDGATGGAGGGPTEALSRLDVPKQQVRLIVGRRGGGLDRGPVNEG